MPIFDCGNIENARNVEGLEPRLPRCAVCVGGHVVRLQLHLCIAALILHVSVYDMIISALECAFVRPHCEV